MKESGWENFIALCRNTDTQGELNELLELLLTSDEQEQLATRVLLLTALLKEEKSQRAIAKELKISIAKITRGSHALKNISPKLRHYLLSELL